MEQKNAIKTTQSTRKSGPEDGHSDAELPEGWTRPTLESLPRPTYWPMALAIGIVFALGGIATSYGLSFVGIALIFISISGWVGELRHDHRS
jgi:hypothetical protein